MRTNSATKSATKSYSAYPVTRSLLQMVSTTRVSDIKELPYLLHHGELLRLRGNLRNGFYGQFGVYV